MCGLAGFSGITASAAQRLILVSSLGEGIDRRGGHGAGFAAERDGAILHQKRMPEWSDAPISFLEPAAMAHACIMHARYATHGSVKKRNAHPFNVTRNGVPKLYGAHNGIIYDARESAIANGRKFSVDSLELFELLADGMLDDIANLEGYGVITWLDAENPLGVNIARLTDSGELAVVSLKSGGFVWGSTKRIVENACWRAELRIDREWELEDGRAYRIEKGIIYDADTKVSLSVPKAKKFDKDAWQKDYQQAFARRQTGISDDEVCATADELGISLEEAEQILEDEREFYGTRLASMVRTT